MRHKTYTGRGRRSKQHIWQAPVFILIPLVIMTTSGGAYLGFHHYLAKSVHPAQPAILTPKPLPTKMVATSSPPATAPAPTHDYTIPPVQDGMVPVVNRIPTTEPVVFLTIDDGITQLSGNLTDMQSNHDVATFFLVYRFIRNNPSYFATLSQITGSDIENHTYDHFLQPNLTYTQQQQDICQGATTITTLFKREPVLFRPPGGAYNNDTRKAAVACGMHALIMWDATINNGVIRYQSGGQLRPGDIVLMHFRPTFSEDIGAFVAAEKKAGLHTDLLVNWLPSS